MRRAAFVGPSTTEYSNSYKGMWQFLIDVSFSDKNSGGGGAVNYSVSSTAVLKVSISISLTRICVKRSQTIIIWLVMGVVISSTSSSFSSNAPHPPYFWTQYTGGSGTCLKLSVVTNSTYAHSAISCVADWTLGILPIFLVWDLAINPRTKVSVAIILALGAL